MNKAIKNILLTLFLLFYQTNISSATNWLIDQKNSKIEFTGKHLETKFTGQFKKFTGKIKFDPKKLDSSWAKINIDPTSVVINDETYSKTILEPDWFNVKKHSKIIYETNKISKISNELYRIEGFLNIKGIKLLHIFEANIKINENVALMKAKTKIQRINYNIGKSSDETGDWVSLEIDVNIYIKGNLTKI